MSDSKKPDTRQAAASFGSTFLDALLGKKPVAGKKGMFCPECGGPIPDGSKLFEMLQNRLSCLVRRRRTGH